MTEKIILVVPCYNEGKRLMPEIFMESLKKNHQLHWLFDVELIQRILKTGKLQVSDFFEEPLLKWTDVGGSTLKFRSFLVAFIDIIKIKINGIK